MAKNEVNKAEALKALKAEFEAKRAAINEQRKSLNTWYFAEKAKIENGNEAEK